MAESARFGIIGAGQIARYVAWIFRADPQIQPVAVADTDRHAAEYLAGEIGAGEVFDDYHKLLDHPGIDAVYIATPPFLHLSMVLDALAAGKHALCEKPFMRSAAEVRAVIAAQQAHPQLKVGCCSCRFHDAGTTRRARQMVAEDDLGEVYRLCFDVVAPPPAPGATLPAWRNDRQKSGGGEAYNWGSYDLDWISYVLGDRFRPHTLFGTQSQFFAVTPERRPPAPGVEGQLAVEMLCDNGLSVHWERRTGEHGPARHLVQIRGTRAGIDLTMTPSEEHGTLVRYAYRGSADLAREVQPESPPEWRSTLVYPIRDFAAAILENRTPAASPQRELLIHAVLDALARSSQTGQAVAVDLSDNVEKEVSA